MQSANADDRMKILIIEDERHLADGLKYNLEAEGYVTSIAADGEAGLGLLKRERFDAVVLDIMLPGMNGFDVAKTMRERRDYTPILMLTARGRPQDVLNGFESGADDYLPKPFDLEIFLARLNGLLRRRDWSAKEPRTPRTPDIVEVNGRAIDFQNLEMRDGGELIHLTLMEVKLLRYMIENGGRAISRNEILQKVWDLQEDTDTRAIDNFIVRLRKYLEDAPDEPKIVQTVRGVGYKFVMPDPDRGTHAEPTP